MPTLRFLQENPRLHFGVRLAIAQDIDDYDWGPLAPKERVPSLLDADGRRSSLPRMAKLLARTRLEELEIELRTQIDAVLAASPTSAHLGRHCLPIGDRADIFEMTLGLAYEHGLALRVGSQPYIDQVQGRGLPTNDHALLDSFSLDLGDKSARYAELLRELPVGRIEWNDRQIHIRVPVDET